VKRAETGPSKTESAADVRWLMERDPGALLLADAEGQVAGSLIVGWDGWRDLLPTRGRSGPPPVRTGDGDGLGEERLHGLGAKRLNAIIESGEDDAMASFVKNIP
jgi:hypothetical protein